MRGETGKFSDFIDLNMTFISSKGHKKLHFFPGKFLLLLSSIFVRLNAVHFPGVLEIELIPQVSRSFVQRLYLEDIFELVE